jgi:hypothetical protein
MRKADRPRFERCKLRQPVAAKVAVVFAATLFLVSIVKGYRRFPCGSQKRSSAIGSNLRNSRQSDSLMTRDMK